ncbi:DNA topology modulation protein [Aquibacillus koreensis]|uniref:DNA topology modulation protein n=1 Tax=Aquibacillus koreensis TaxID=279446 RepID=A0A9X3WN33_9BACI|nr:DNA topology modulation protein [Aquibacillus koreensis]MCT2535819.1 DNA topology modulation protein [Aquibacillus koreensis]MDC3420274.1 DNA topology modulation protein [Aquibacillus koreensis]
MKKIMIIGSGGAGKSTLAKQLGQVLHLPVHHLDAYFWKPGWESVTREELATMQEKIVKQESWIIDGNYSGTMDIRLQNADTVIYLNYSTIRCLYGIVKRRIQYRKKTRPDMGKGCPEKLDKEFFLWVASYQKKKAPLIKNKLSKANHLTIIEFTHPKQTKQFLQKLP